MIGWNESNRAYIRTHGVRSVEWSNYRHPLPEHVYDVFMRYWRNRTYQQILTSVYFGSRSRWSVDNAKYAVAVRVDTHSKRVFVFCGVGVIGRYELNSCRLLAQMYSQRFVRVGVVYEK